MDTVYWTWKIEFHLSLDLCLKYFLLHSIAFVLQMQAEPRAVINIKYTLFYSDFNQSGKWWKVLVKFKNEKFN